MPPFANTTLRRAAQWVVTAGIAAIAGTAQAQVRSGEQVYQAVCASCHAGVVAGTPRTGDRKAWAPLIREGQATLTGVAWVGIRGMPPRGGDATLTLEEFARATAYMANAGGARWPDPGDAMLQRIRAVEKRRLEQARTKP